jgi:cysteinyl-tRNA synthetase
MIALTQTLLEKGYAYEKLRSIYFDISRFKDYGKLSNVDLDKIRIGKTVDLDQYEKENPKDFTLLKRSTLSELKSGLFFKTKWGNVRPGWHLECATIALKTLGPTHDIHTSGVALAFPHHENAIAISQAATDRPLANYWLHNEPVMFSGPNAFDNVHLTLRDLLAKGFTGREIRYWLLSRHYRKPIFFSQKKLSAVRNTISHLDKFVQKLYFAKSASVNPDIDQVIYALKQEFVAAMDDDFNVAAGLAALFRFTRDINLKMDQRGLAVSDREKLLAALDRINSVLGFMDLEPTGADPEVEALIEKRELARSQKDWPAADDLRREMEEMGIEVIDTQDGPQWRRTEPQGSA